MKSQSRHTAKKDASQRPERLQNQLLFWLAAALAPESMPWYSGGYSSSLLRQIDELRQTAVDSQPGESDLLEHAVEEPRRAA